MPGEPGSRPLLPHAAHAQTFTFAPAAPAQQPQQRNYVFVDEHNRHKRLKVMRACEGCRRRKIKCDAATTNTWPCAACTRLKLTCVPPTISYENETGDTPGIHAFEISPIQQYNPTDGPISAGSTDEYKAQFPMRHPSTDSMSNYTPAPAPATYGGAAAHLYSTQSYVSQASAPTLLSYAAVPQPPVSAQEPRYQPEVLYTSSTPRAESSPTHEDSWHSDDVSGSGLADVMGQLKIGPEAVAPWMNQQKSLAEVPAIGEIEIQLPRFTNADMTIRIPAEMMPSEAQALHYFDYFFANIHPYIPVLHRGLFYQQWQTNRDSISPLLLEGIFACTSFMLNDLNEGNKWLALAARHEESFKDVPRISTIQAMVMVLKAREFSPKRGYYYRSWMTIVNMVAMAKDLDLNEHFENHEMGISCNSPAHECLIKTRLWHVLFTLEINIGGAQGRFDFGVRHDTVDFSVPDSVPGNDEHELQVSRQYAYFLRVARNISVTNALLGRLRKKRKDWALDPEFMEHNADYAAWDQELPAEMQIVFPEDGSLPWTPSHFIANTHVYHLLTVIMQHRSQMVTLNAMHNPAWKHHMMICYAGAKKLCKLQEAILRDYGLAGLSYMQRGLSFTIYAVLTCNMLHLAAITSPDPELSGDARDYFARHMRILERCIPSWPMPEVIKQINALREAFSADTSKPFELKAQFPYGSPSSTNQSPPLGEHAYPARQAAGHEQSHMEQPGQVHYNTHHPITPPMSTISDTKTDSPIAQSLVMMTPDQQQQQTPLSMANPVNAPWSPSRIFDHWNVAFGMASKPPSDQSSSPPLSLQTTTGQSMMPVARVLSGQDGLLQHQQSPYPPQTMQHATPIHTLPTQPHAPQSAVGYHPPSAVDSFVTPSMWQDVVASSFPDGGIKRRWDYGGQTSLAEPMIKRAR